MAKQFAIGIGTKVSIWAQETKVDDQGRHFDCLNGGWSGCIEPDGLLYVDGDSKGNPATIIWEGHVTGNYTSAIIAIEHELKTGEKQPAVIPPPADHDDVAF